MKPLAELMPDVRPVADESLRYHVRSRSRPQDWHLVDLGEREGRGWCGCEAHQFKGKTCHHISRAQKHLAITVTRTIIERRNATKTKTATSPVGVSVPRTAPAAQ